MQATFRLILLVFELLKDNLYPNHTIHQNIQDQLLGNNLLDIISVTV